MLKFIDTWAEEIESNISTEDLKKTIIKLFIGPFPARQLTNLLVEMPSQKKKQIASILNIKKMSANDPMLVNLIRINATRDSKAKAKLLKAIMLYINELYGDKEELSAEDYLSREDEITKAFGSWHYYWGLRLFPMDDNKIEERFAELEEQLEDAVTTAEESEIKVESETLKQSQKESKENNLVIRERELRQKAEQETDRLNAELRKLMQSHKRLSEENDKYNTQIEQMDLENNRLAEQVKTEIQRRNDIEREKAKLNSQVNNLERSNEQINLEKQHLQEKFEIDLTNRIKEMEVENKRLVEQLSNEEQHRNDIEREMEELNVWLKDLQQANEQLILENQILQEKFEEEQKILKSSEIRNLDIVDRFIESIHDEMSYDLARIKSGQTSRGEQAAIRKKLTKYISLIDMIEDLYPLTNESAATKESFSDPAPLKAYSASATVDEETFVVQPSVEIKQNGDTKIGTFYRQDHGGIVKFESGESTKITESIVNTVGLEHEAEVECRIQPREGGGLHLYIEKILLQGDDSFAPIKQYQGYVEIGDHFTYYCVDIEDSNNRFPLYERDYEIQQPKDGAPCLFNVAVDGQYARLSKLYYQGERIIKDSVTKNNKAVDSLPRKKNDSSIQEPYLEGCSIVIIGGEKKWFESVIKETGAELYHENGTNPDRIHAKLRRANAMFMLKTATSHGAFWSCQDIAKEYGIPYYTIQGSKSNLRGLLWENRDRILNSKVESLSV